MTTTTATDYYALLGVDPGATTAQIKSAYRKLAKQYHPDVNTSSDAAERFREITEAYDTLTDPDRRRRYERLHGTHRLSDLAIGRCTHAKQFNESPHISSIDNRGDFNSKKITVLCTRVSARLRAMRQQPHL